jgi:hypothetical protein
VDFALKNNLMSGYGDGRFGPNDHLSRAMLAQILYNDAGKPAVTSTTAFSDVADGVWYTNAVTWAYQEGIVKGYGDGKFGPDDEISRQDLVVMLWRYSGEAETSRTTLDFQDADQVSEYAREAMLWAHENGIINGDGSGNLLPRGLATRAQTAQMKMNFLNSKG